MSLSIEVAYKIPEPPGVVAVTGGGRTYLGNPPAVTLAQRDPASVHLLAVAMGVVLVVGTIDLVVRSAVHSARWGWAALVAGVLIDADPGRDTVDAARTVPVEAPGAG